MKLVFAFWGFNEKREEVLKNEQRTDLRIYEPIISAKTSHDPNLKRNLIPWIDSKVLV